MMPIKIEPFMIPIYVENESDIIGDNYEMERFYTFFPEFLEQVYTGDNKEKLANANIALINYLDKRNQGDFQYLASWKKKQKGETILCEYYSNKEGEESNIIAFLIIIPSNKKYYTRLESVCIYSKKEEVVQ